MPYKDKDKQREYQRQWITKRRVKFFSNKSCVQCGSQKNLELDHIDPSTKISHTIWSWSETRRNEELAKCQILCEECHKNKTIEYNKELFSKPLIHGTIAGYKKNCRCERCHKALLVWWREYRNAKLSPVV